MTQISQLTTTVESAMHINSTYMYCVFNGSDYRIKPTDLQEVLGRREYCTIRRSSPQSLQDATGAIIQCNTVYHNSGGFSNASSLAVIRAPRPMLVRASVGVNFTNLGNFPAQLAILRNNSFNTGEQWDFWQFYQQGSQTRVFNSKPIVMNSGDHLSCYMWQNDGAVRVVNTLNFTMISLVDL